MEVLRQAEAAASVPDLCQEHGLRTATSYNSSSKPGGIDVSLMARMKELVDENGRLKKLYVEVQIKAAVVAEALKISP
jgi:putative transposase